MVGHKTDDEGVNPPLRSRTGKSPTNERDKEQQSRRAAPKSRDIDLDRVLYDPEYRQAVQQALSPDTPPGRPTRSVKPQKG